MVFDVDAELVSLVTHVDNQIKLFWPLWIISCGLTKNVKQLLIVGKLFHLHLIS